MSMDQILSKLDSQEVSKLKIAVVGDFMLDSFVYGDVYRISPEAPVPVVVPSVEKSMLGGAGNALANLLSLGVKPIPFGLVGKDGAALEVTEILKKNGVKFGNMITDNSRPTPRKMRVIGNRQQIVRLDWEKTHVIDKKLEARVIKKLRQDIPKVDAVIVSDYDKGFFSKILATKLIGLAKKNDKPVIVDTTTKMPGKSPKFEWFKEANVFTPNREELYQFFDMSVAEEDGKIAMMGRTMRKTLQAQAILITLSENGAMLIYKNQAKHIPARKVKVFDVSGAGDTVVAVVAVSLALGKSYLEAATLANLAGSLVVSKPGTATISINELNKAITK